MIQRTIRELQRIFRFTEKNVFPMSDFTMNLELGKCFASSSFKINQQNENPFLLSSTMKMI